MLYSYKWCYLFDELAPDRESDAMSFKAGDHVYVKPPGAKCSTEWPRTTVSKVNSPTKLEINGVPRHVADVRPVWTTDTGSEGDTEQTKSNDADQTEDLPLALRRPERTRHPPSRFMFETYAN